MCRLLVAASLPSAASAALGGGPCVTAGSYARCRCLLACALLIRTAVDPVVLGGRALYLLSAPSFCLPNHQAAAASVARRRASKRAVLTPRMMAKGRGGGHRPPPPPVVESLSPPSAEYSRRRRTASPRVGATKALFAVVICCSLPAIMATGQQASAEEAETSRCARQRPTDDRDRATQAKKGQRLSLSQSLLMKANVDDTVLRRRRALLLTAALSCPTSPLLLLLSLVDDAIQEIPPSSFRRRRPPPAAAAAASTTAAANTAAATSCRGCRRRGGDSAPRGGVAACAACPPSTPDSEHLGHGAPSFAPHSSAFASCWLTAARFTTIALLFCCPILLLSIDRRTI